MSSIISASQHQIDNLRSLILSLGSDPVNVFQNTLLPSVKRSKFKYLGAAIALYVVSKAYPRENDYDRATKFMLPTWKETNGIMTAWGQFGWEVVIANPEAVRTILYKTDIFPKSEVFQVQAQLHQTLITKFFGTNNMAFANTHEWRKRRKVSYCLHF
ncbi:hypothetical protein BC943DRAFT_341001 [Umbelopsis sp. AD052]|nr:hypothetical protein BC943DRAFT_341001 [Umbelopsis sp. AD052]